MKKSIVLLNIVALITGFSIVFSCLHVSAAELSAPTFEVIVYGVNSSSAVNVTNNCTISGNTVSYSNSPYLYDRYIIYIRPIDLGGPVYNITDRSSWNWTSIHHAYCRATIDGQGYQCPNVTTGNSFNYVYPADGVLTQLQYVVYAVDVQSYPGLVFTLNVSFKTEDDVLISQINTKLGDTNAKLDQVSGKLDQTNSLLEEGLTFVPSSSVIDQESGDLGGGLLDDLGSGASDINAAIDDHIPDVSSWLANNPQIYQDMLNLSGLANYVMLGIAHSDPSIFIYLSLMAFVSLLMVIEVNLKRGPTSFHIHQVAQRHYVNNQRSSHHFGFN